VSAQTTNENGHAPEGDMAVSIASAGSIRLNDTAEDNAARNRRAIAAFHTTMFLDDLVGAIREMRAVDRIRRQREADGDPAEVESC